MICESVILNEEQSLIKRDSSLEKSRMLRLGAKSIRRTVRKTSWPSFKLWVALSLTSIGTILTDDIFGLLHCSCCCVE